MLLQQIQCFWTEQTWACNVSYLDVWIFVRIKSHYKTEGSVCFVAHSRQVEVGLFLKKHKTSSPETKKKKLSKYDLYSANMSTIYYHNSTPPYFTCQLLQIFTNWFHLSMPIWILRSNHMIQSLESQMVGKNSYLILCKFPSCLIFQFNSKT